MKSTTRIEIKFLIPIFLVLSEGATAEDPLLEFYRGPFQAVVRDPSGETVFVDSNRQIYQWKKRRFEPIALVGDPKPHVANAVEDENGDLVLWGALPEGGIQLFASDWTHLRTFDSAGLSGKEAWMDREESGAVWVHDDLAWAWRVSG